MKKIIFLEVSSKKKISAIMILIQYTSTLTSFTSVLNLNYTYNETEKLFDRSKMFPETMKPHLVYNYPLFQILKSLEINFLGGCTTSRNMHSI